MKIIRKGIAGSYGEIIFCADRSLLAEMRKRMIFERENFAPYHRRVLRDKETGMDRDIIERKLESLRRYASRIESKKPLTRTRLDTEKTAFPISVTLLKYTTLLMTLGK